MREPYPFAAIVGQDELKTALLVAALDPAVGGVLALGDRGTGKSTAVRALAALLPPLKPARRGQAATAVPVVDLPLGATEDRVVGGLDLERALAGGEKVFAPGLLARAHGGFLYVDEVNLLEDHIVDLLIDVAASGENVVEREGLSVRHPARFVLVGSGNPEEGELRPQLLDRFGLAVDVRTPTELAERVEVVRRRDAYERDPVAFHARWAGEQRKLARRLISGRTRLAELEAGHAVLEQAARLCIALGTDGLRGELTLVRAARALAAFEGSATVGLPQLRAMALPALRHRLRRDPLDDSDAAARVQRAIGEVWGGAA